MKELSIEEKAKRYDEALAWMRDLYPTMEGAIKEDAEHYFPELKDSDSERIRKPIIEFFKNYSEHGTWKSIPDVTKWIDWLEKQREHTFFRNTAKVGDIITKSEEGVLVNLSQFQRVVKKDKKQELEDNLNKALEKETPESWNEFLDEQEHIDKVEQKGMNIAEEDMTPFQKEVFCIIDITIEEERGLKQVCDKLLALASNEIEHKAHSGKYERDEAALILEELEDFIDTLKAKEVNIEEEIKFNYNPVNGLEFEEFERIAKYFFELGLEAQKGE